MKTGSDDSECGLVVRGERRRTHGRFYTATQPPDKIIVKNDNSFLISQLWAFFFFFSITIPHHDVYTVSCHVVIASPRKTQHRICDLARKPSPIPIPLQMPVYGYCLFIFIRTYMIVLYTQNRLLVHKCNFQSINQTNI